MKKTIAILLIIALGAQCLVKVGIAGAFMLNKDYIAKVLCINRDKPQLQCDGKCHLKKQLKKQEQQEQKTPSGMKEISEVVLFGDTEKISFAPVSSSSLIVFSPYLSFAPSTPSDPIFHPPC